MQKPNLKPTVTQTKVVKPMSMPKPGVKILHK